MSDDTDLGSVTEDIIQHAEAESADPSITYYSDYKGLQSREGARD